MGTTLTGLTPSTTYDALIKVGDNGPIDGTLKTLSDGLGNDLPVQASTTAVNFTATLTQSGTALQPVLVSGTSIKTVNSNSLLGAGDVAVQPTLVSGVSIKTVNSTSLLGSGDIPIPIVTPSGVSGAIQFSNGSAFASDAANFFWDNTNKRLGVGTNAPTSRMQIVTDDATNPQAFGNQTTVMAGTASQGALISAFSSTNGAFLNALWPGNAWFKMNYGGTNHTFSTSGTVMAVIDTNTTFGNGATSLGARLGIKGSGSTSATTSLLVQNSAGTEAFRINDGLVATFANNVNASNFIGNIRSDSYLTADGGFFALRTSSTGNSRLPQSVAIGTSSEPAASAALDIVSTTKGVLFPRMTTTQKNAISAIAGLVVYDSTTNKLQCYNGSTWNDLF